MNQDSITSSAYGSDDQDDAVRCEGSARHAYHAGCAASAALYGLNCSLCRAPFGFSAPHPEHHERSSNGRADGDDDLARLRAAAALADPMIAQEMRQDDIVAQRRRCKEREQLLAQS